MEKNKWYLVQVVPGAEEKIKNSLISKEFGAADGIEEILIPIKETILKSGKIREKPLFPGYLFVKGIMTDDVWYMIRNTEYVTGIVGSSGQRTKPTSISEVEIERMVNRAKESTVVSEKKIVDVSTLDYVEGEMVLINQGSFTNNHAKVMSIDLETGIVIVNLEFLGRVVEVELQVNQVSKI